MGYEPSAEEYSLMEKGASIRSQAKKVIGLLSGCMIYAVCTNVFIRPFGIVFGGFTGIALMLEKWFSCPVGTATIVMNIPFLLIGWRKLGRSNILWTTAMVLILGALTDMFSFLPPVTQSSLMAAVYSGVMIGIEIGLGYRLGLSSGGTELVAQLLKSCFPHLNISRTLAVVDLLVVSAGTLAFANPENLLLAIALIFTSSRISDMIITGMDSGMQCTIITTQPDQVYDALMKQVQRGVTRIKGEGMYSSRPYDVLIMVVRRPQVYRVKQAVMEADPDSFLTVGKVSDILGRGFTGFSSGIPGECRQKSA